MPLLRPLPPRRRAVLRRLPHRFCRRSVSRLSALAATVGPYAVIDGRCKHCRDETLPFDAAVRLGPYDGPLREAVLRIKHHSGEGLAELLGELWADHAGPALHALGAEAIVPVPLHWRRRWRRGYNQSEALAHGLAARLRLPVRPAWLRRVAPRRFRPGRPSPAGARTSVAHSPQRNFLSPAQRSCSSMT